MCHKDQAHIAFETLKDISGSRKFLNRMYRLRDNHISNKIYPNKGFHSDLLWFIQLLGIFNRVVAFRCIPVHHHVSVDATLKGSGQRRIQLLSKVGVYIRHPILINFW